jgi:calcineurin-like phosphoesterase family protein
MPHWYTADLHLGHANIIRYCARPFSSADEMDRHYLTTLRTLVAPEDDLWILGDFGFARNAAARTRLASLFEAIPGRKHLIRGNHDHKSVTRLGWASVHDLLEIEEDGHRLVLCHYPMLSWNRARYGAVHLFGHVHDDLRGFRGAVNVGVDCWDHRPVRLHEILARSEALPRAPWQPDGT